MMCGYAKGQCGKFFLSLVDTLFLNISHRD
jgi:hypothetical protein